jgi:LacI family transcriptional regulator
VSVISFDDSDLAAWLRPALSSIALPHLEMGRKAVELLLDFGSPATVERVPMPLVSRSSLAPA